MKSKRRGKTTSARPGAEILNVSKFGIWILIKGDEYFLDYKRHPWFQEASVGEIYDFEFRFGHHLRWPSLDVDLEVESLKHPEKYPLSAAPKPRKRAHPEILPKKRSRRAA